MKHLLPALFVSTIAWNANGCQHVNNYLPFVHNAVEKDLEERQDTTATVSRDSVSSADAASGQ